MLLVYWPGSSFPSPCENGEVEAAGRQQQFKMRSIREELLWSVFSNGSYVFYWAPRGPCAILLKESYNTLLPLNVECFLLRHCDFLPVLWSRLDDPFKQPNSNNSKHVVNHLQEGDKDALLRLADDDAMTGKKKKTPTQQNNLQCHKKHFLNSLCTHQKYPSKGTQVLD